MTRPYFAFLSLATTAMWLALASNAASGVTVTFSSSGGPVETFFAGQVQESHSQFLGFDEIDPRLLHFVGFRSSIDLTPNVPTLVRTHVLLNNDVGQNDNSGLPLSDTRTLQLQFVVGGVPVDASHSVTLTQLFTPDQFRDSIPTPPPLAVLIPGVGRVGIALFSGIVGDSLEGSTGGGAYLDSTFVLTVPEPGTGWLAMCGVVAGVRLRGRRHCEESTGRAGGF